MAAKVVHFLQPPSAGFLDRKIKELVSDSKNIVFDHPHFQARLKGRDLSMRHVLETIRNGAVISGPTKDEWGDWRLKLCRRVAGRRVQVVVAFKGDHVVIVTVI
jgi:Domain of unknown function (DUF4258)